MYSIAYYRQQLEPSGTEFFLARRFFVSVNSQHLGLRFESRQGARTSYNGTLIKPLTILTYYSYKTTNISSHRHYCVLNRTLSSVGDIGCSHAVYVLSVFGNVNNTLQIVLYIKGSSSR